MLGEVDREHRENFDGAQRIEKREESRRLCRRFALGTLDCNLDG